MFSCQFFVRQFQGECWRTMRAAGGWLPFLALFSFALMTNAKYIGLARDTGRSVEDLAHIQQSVSDILRTPVGSRVMRRDYGSLLSELTDRPQNAALRLQIMAACYSAILKWEPRVSLTGITFETTFDGKMVVDITGIRKDTSAAISLTLPVS
jgi:phage baseplate assembly protein W